MRARMFALALMLGLLCTTGTAQQQALKLRISDTSGASVEITNVDLDYSDYPSGFGFYTPVHERQGIRIKQGSGQVTVRWTDIAVLSLQAQTVGWTFTITGDLQLVSGTTSKVEVLPVSKDVTGKTELGDYFVSLRNIREIRPVR